MYDSGRRNSSRRSSQHMESSSVGDGYGGEEGGYVLPRNGLRKAFIIGLVEAAITIVLPIILFIVSLFGGGSHLSDSTSLQTALLGCSSICFVPFITFAVGGMVAGKVVVKRRLGFVAGAVGGGLFSLGTVFIPIIPGLIRTTAITNATGIWVLIGGGAIFFQCLILAGIGGSISWGGACVTSAKHPYYQSRVRSVK